MPTADERGLVISAPVKISQESLQLTGALDQQDLRFALLFWDKLDFPKNNFALLGDDTADFLEEAGVLTRTSVTVHLAPGRVNPGDVLIAAHLEAYRTLDRTEPGVWSLGVGENSVSFPQRDLEDGRGILVRLHQAIPVPDKDVPLQDILDFKVKHRDELLALRYHLETIYQRIINAGDGELALQTEIGALELAIVDYLKVAKSTPLRFINTPLEANLNIPAAIRAGWAGLTTYTAGFGATASLLAGVATAAIEIKASASLKNHEVSKTPFRYISSFHNRVF
jgi:Family of unknown function (DUF6236)